MEPLSAEHMAAMKQRTAPIMKACVKAVMNGEAIVLGKNVVPCRVVSVACGKLAAMGPIECSKVPIGLYPRNAAKSAPAAGT